MFAHRRQLAREGRLAQARRFTRLLEGLLSHAVDADQGHCTVQR